MQVDKDFDQSNQGVYNIAMDNGIVSSETTDLFEVGTNDNCKIAPAAVITMKHSRSAGLTTANYNISISNSTAGVISHEVGILL